ncbi:hypothetical protein Acy02nite_79900 [Actinoplanes cyaneus]|uniref:Uncharacterized protein n=1 Tax=Actinoplanes cyaneus TaxID=52696 RepID=A0A919IQ42_9ACTN|nr:hypothetical protein [Actinoplanes cyaneus]MCW2140764.1 hypothetical protein [Actinoplanes cyaneus]GID70109.1 hypothetical protein Acy02nite_79900 [Actinoplanes cyaneus]
MRKHRLLAAAVTMLCLAACSGTDGKPATGTDPKPASWPQPVGGRLTPQMCDLLTPDDFAASGVTALNWEDRKASESPEPSSLSCHALGGHWLSLALQPDPESAHLSYQQNLADHRRRVKNSQLQENGVPDADESWFDVSDIDGHDLWVRRGALLVGLNIGFLHDDQDFDARKAAATLVSTLLQRIPEVGKNATGKPHELVLRADSKDVKTARVQYTDPITGEVKEEDVSLPWEYRAKFPWFGSRGVRIVFSVYNLTPKLPPPAVTCSTVVDGAQVATRTSTLTGADCAHNHKDGA